MCHLESLACQISEYGVRHVFGIPGSGPSFTLIDSLSQKGVQFHIVHFEGCAAIMAGTFGRLSGISGVSIGIKGPGLANMIPGIAACSLESFPAVNITEAYPPDAPISLAHKRIDHQRLAASVVKTSTYWSQGGSSFKQLAKSAEAECPGPVLLNITNSAPRESGELFSKECVPSNESTVVSKLIADSCQPVIIAGSLAIRAKLSDALNSLSFPVFTTASAKGVVDETLAHAAGVFTGAGVEIAQENNLLGKADLVIGIGLRHNEVLSVEPFSCKTLLLDPLGDLLADAFGFSINTWFHSEDHWKEFWENLHGVEWGNEEISQSKKEIDNYLLKDGFLPANIMQVVYNHFCGKARVVVDTGLFCTVAEHIWHASSPSLYLGSGQGRYMGISLPQGIAASLYDSTLPTVIFCGDGSIGMFTSELKMAADLKLPLIIILLSDGKFGTLRGRSLKDGLSEKPLTIYSPSWIEVIEGLGINSAQVNSEYQLHQILAQWDRKPLYIETTFDPEKYRIMTQRLR